MRTTDKKRQVDLVSFLSSGSNTVTREFTFPVPSGTVVLKVPFPMTQEDYSKLLESLSTFKEGVVKSEVITIPTNLPEWEKAAESAAKHKLRFNVVGFKFAHHIGFYEHLAKTYDLDSSFDPVKELAWFKPKNPKA